MITWSLMHPTALNADYMKRVIREAENYHVDSFEICALCHAPLGGMDGLISYQEYPSVAATLDQEAIRQNRETLRSILSLAHASGRPVYYWHREVTAWPAVLTLFPSLRDKNGEFDLLGQDFERLLRYKIAKTFEEVPELDGLVLTLTEADFSAIHNSTPDVYPPAKVVEKITGIFAEEHQKRGKRLILRSFGSIAEDYEQILAGAALASKRFSFEVETKITPYDFDPFMPDNPYIRPMENLTIGAECDCLGEFLGAGYLPAENVRHIVRYVRYAQAKHVDRYAIRLDRVGHNVFDAYPINLYAYHQAIEHPEKTADDILREYAERHYPAVCRQELLQLGEDGFALVEHLNYIDHNLIFHLFPPEPDLKWLKAGGVFTVFAENARLAEHSGLWGILYWQNTPGRRAILQEKELALQIAEKGLATVERIRPHLSESEYRRLRRLWTNARTAAVGMLHFIRVICAYFDGMDALDENAAALRQEINAMEKATGAEAMTQSHAFKNGLEHNLFQYIPEDAADIYQRPLLGIAKLLLEEYGIEMKERKAAGKLCGDGDFILPGTITDDIRCARNMHASHSLTQKGRIGRFIGNTVFPNGFLRMTLRSPESGSRLHLEGEGLCQVEIDGTPHIADLTQSPEIPLPPGTEHTLCFHKQGQDYPWLTLVACRPA